MAGGSCGKDAIPASVDACAANTVDDLPLTNAGASFGLLVRMLTRESEVRLGTKVQLEYKVHGYDKYVEITERAQLQVAEEFASELVACGEALGVSPVQAGVVLMQAAENLVQGDEEKVRTVKELSFYRKYNRCYDGKLGVGEPAPLCVGVHNVTWLRSPIYRLEIRAGDIAPSKLYIDRDISLTNTYLTPLNSLPALNTDQPMMIIAGSYS
jgi:hypothetical protein